MTDMGMCFEREREYIEKSVPFDITQFDLAVAVTGNVTFPITRDVTMQTFRMCDTMSQPAAIASNNTGNENKMV